MYERDNNLEHSRTETNTGAFATQSGTAHGSRSVRGAQAIRTTGETTECSVSKGGLAHGNRGRKPVQAISEEVPRQVIELATTTYAGCNYQHLRDLLAERDGIELSRAGVRRILLAAGHGSPKQHRRRRARCAHEGCWHKSTGVDMLG
jgi:hypothetical protein